MLDLLQRVAEFFLFQFVLGFCRHLPLLVSCVLLVLLVSGRIGRKFGAHQVVWHERPLKRIFAGFALAALFFNVCLVAYILEVEDLRESGGATTAANRIVDDKQSKNLGPNAKAGETDSPASRHAWRHWVEPPSWFRIPRTWMPTPSDGDRILDPTPIFWYVANLCLLLLAAFLLVRLSGPFRIPDRAGQRWRSLLFFVGVTGACCFLLAFVLGAIWLYQVSEVQLVFRPLFVWMSSVTTAPEPSATALHFGMFCYVLVLLASFFLYRLDVRGLTVQPVVTVCTLWGLGVSSYGLVLYWLERFYPLLATGLIVLLLVGFCIGGIPKYKFRLPVMKGIDYHSPVDLSTLSTTGPGVGSAPATVPAAGQVRRS